MRRAVLIVLLVAMGAATVAALVALRPTDDTVGVEFAFVPPERNAPEPPAILPPPAVPPKAASLPPLAFSVETTWTGPSGTRGTTQQVLRTAGRVRLVIDGGRQEWLFVRNAVARDRASGYLVDHDAHEIRLHDESELRSQLGLTGWLDVLTMRFDPALIGTLRDTGERQHVAGASFARYVSDSPAGTGIVEVWWSDELLLPLMLTARDAESTMVTSVVKGLAALPDTAPLADPAARFPQYESLDAVDARDHR